MCWTIVVWCSENATKALPISLRTALRSCSAYSLSEYPYEVILFIFWRLAKWGERDVCMRICFRPSVLLSYCSSVPSYLFFLSDFRISCVVVKLFAVVLRVKGLTRRIDLISPFVFGVHVFFCTGISIIN